MARSDDTGRALVCERPDEARVLVAAGHDVVVIVAEGQRAPAVFGPGRLAVFVGDPTDPDVRAAAEAMCAELFPGSAP